MEVHKDDQFSLFRAFMNSQEVTLVPEKTLLDARFKVLMAYRVLDVYELMVGSPLRPPTTFGPISDNQKAVRRLIKLCCFILILHCLL